MVMGWVPESNENIQGPVRPQLRTDTLSFLSSCQQLKQIHMANPKVEGGEMYSSCDKAMEMV